MSIRRLIRLIIMTDEYYMELALRQAKVASAKGEVPIGAVLVSDNGKVMSQTHNLVMTLNDPTAHAEILAIRESSKHYGLRLTGASLYVNMEPCPMCAGAIVLSRIRRLVYAMPSPYGGAESLFNITNNSMLNHQVEVTAGCLEEKAKRIVKSFFISKR